MVLGQGSHDGGGVDFSIIGGFSCSLRCGIFGARAAAYTVVSVHDRAGLHPLRFQKWSFAWDGVGALINTEARLNPICIYYSSITGPLIC